MAKYVIYRDDYDYPIEANTFEELRKLRTEGNWSFISHGYGSVCLEKGTGKYYDIYTGEEVSRKKAKW